MTKFTLTRNKEESFFQMDFKFKTAVLTGATGVLGSALLNKLVENGINVYVVCHVGSQRNKQILNNPLLHKIDCNLENINELPELIHEKIDVFYHFAWLGTQVNSNRLNMYLQLDNIKYALDAVKASSALGVKVFIGAGSQAEFGRVNGVLRPDTPVNPISGYGMAKLCAGQMTRFLCHEFGIKQIWPRVVSTYGPHDAKKTLISVVIDKLLNNERPSLTKGEQIWDYLFAEGAAEAFFRMATKGKDGAVYVLGSGEPHPLKEFMYAIRDAINSSAELGIGEIPYLPDQAMHLEADITSLKEDLNWSPTTNFQTGIKKTIEWYKAMKGMNCENKKNQRQFTSIY